MQNKVRTQDRRIYRYNYIYTNRYMYKNIYKHIYLNDVFT